MERIKLLGLTLGKTPPSENVVIKDLNLKSGKKFMMLGEFSELLVISCQLRLEGGVSRRRDVTDSQANVSLTLVALLGTQARL